MQDLNDLRENREFAAEFKFLINPELAEPIRDWARARLPADPHAVGPTEGYRITSLYFDTARFDVFLRNGSYGRGKLRIRRYGASRIAFLERKIRTRKVLAKRRSTVTLEEIKRLSRPEPVRGWGGFWFHRRILKRELAPVCQVSYLRMAREAMTLYGPIRLTLDEDLRARPASRLGFQTGEAPPILPDQRVLELKFRYAMPALFKNLVEEFALIPRPFSKYRRAVTALGLAPASEEAARINSPVEYA